LNDSLDIRPWFISAQAGSEAIADGLNPLAISHIPRNISFNIIGTPKMIADVGMEAMEAPARWPKIAITPAASENGAPIRPQTDINRGMSLD